MLKFENTLYNFLCFLDYVDDHHVLQKSFVLAFLFYMFFLFVLIKKNKKANAKTRFSLAFPKSAEKARWS